ncbi:CD1247 N-terminal domain-containing protein [Clostridium scatologenes]|uniref:CD1247 N-terminal domain-containing protein n=1 Tax=Clostridium scatologenes TaxID=1548 RepID=UPI000491674C|nr:CD1247 N-terminal domain-containing protein [Clostridium scatologenes]
MSDIISKVAYLNGLVDGLEIDTTTKEGKVLTEIINVLKVIAEEVDEISESQKDMEDYINAIDEDLSSLQDDIYDDDYELCEDEGNNFIQLKCFNCGDDVYVDKDIVKQKEKITCPNCHNLITTSSDS